jgi:hypothetical protein
LPEEEKDSPTSHSLKEIYIGRFIFESVVFYDNRYSLLEGLFMSIESVSNTISKKYY